MYVLTAPLMSSVACVLMWCQSFKQFFFVSICSSMAGLEEFCNLEELVLDNNNITDSTVFPHLEHLHTLTLNKNKVSKLLSKPGIIIIIIISVFFVSVHKMFWTGVILGSSFVRILSEDLRISEVLA